MIEDDDTKDILAKIVVLYDYIDSLKHKFPSPRPSRVEVIITAFERRVLAETEKLKDIEKNK